MEPVLLNRIQFSLTIGFHILFPVLTIGMSVFLLIIEILWYKTADDLYYRHFRFWSRIFLLNFAMGIVTGIVMEFQFGTNWAMFSKFAGGFFGNILGFEAAIAFAAEAAFLALMIFGWRHISRGMHLFSTFMVCFMAILSAFWIVDANSWMQAPSGVIVRNGRLEVQSYWDAIFNPFWLISFLHKLFACFQISLLVIGGISSGLILKNRNSAFFFRSLKIAFFVSVFVTPFQILLGDSSARLVYSLQPEKGAAMESFWETNPKGKGASWAIIAWPDSKEAQNRFSITIPYMLSLLAKRSLTGTVVGLKEFPADRRPPVVAPFYSFRIMTALGFYFFILMMITFFSLRKACFSIDKFILYRKTLWMWVVSLPLGYLAMETGWIVREVGRQPWSIYHMMKTADGVSPSVGALLPWSLAIYCSVYILLFVFFIIFCRKIILEGPDLVSVVPAGLAKAQPGPEESTLER